jgi:hypothetical protein
VPNLNANLLSVAQLTQACNIAEFWLVRFYVHDLRKGKLIVVDELLDSTDNLYKFCDTTQLDTEPTALVAHIYERSRIWHELFRHLNF